MKIGIIGGSGFNDPDILHKPQRLVVQTQYGKPSSSLLIGQIEGVEVVILARQGH